MGIQGLFTYLTNHDEECIKYVDLVDIARQRNGIELLVDFYAFDHYVLENMMKSLRKYFRNDFLQLSGGEYEFVHKYFTKLVSDLRCVGINLVMFIDGAKGSSPEQSKQKMETWKKGHYNDLARVKKIFEVCDGTRNVESLTAWDKILPVCTDIQTTETLRQMNVEIVQCTVGEADVEIARAFLNRPKAFGILSNDTDFCIFKDSVLLPLNFFDKDCDLGLGVRGCAPNKPAKLIAGLVTQQNVMQSLGIAAHPVMIEFALFVGNDFTNPLLKRRQTKANLDIMDPMDLREVARWITHYGVVENHPFLKQEMNRCPEFAEAVHHSRMFYNLQLELEKRYKSDLTRHLDVGVSAGLYPPNFMGIHHNLYWHKMLLEDMDYGHPCIEWLLTELRSFVYKMLLTNEEERVSDYGRTPYEDLTICEVKPHNRHLLTVDRIKSSMINPNLIIFHTIIMHQETDFDLCFFNRYGRRNGFTIYCLRYFLTLNRRKNLHIELSEFLDLIAMALCGRKSEDEVSFYQELNICPNKRCLTIGNWFQDIYRHAYYMLGKALQLTKEFPKPRDIYSGAMWVVFYMSGTRTFALTTPRSVTKQDIQRVIDHKRQIIDEKRHIVGHIVDGHFRFNTR